MRALLIAAGVAASLALPRLAFAAPDAFAGSLDHPLATKIVRAKGETSEITCTYYADLMVRETGTDSPEPDDATLVTLPHGAARPACSATAPKGAVKVKTEGYALEGRRGGFLIWDVSDPNGAEPFLVMDAKTGRTLFEDGLSPTLRLRRTASLENGKLRLTYTRGFNAPCSLAAKPKSCWASLVAGGKVAKGMPTLTAPPKSCLAAYRKTPADDPSVVTYPVDLTLDAAGKAQIISFGPVSCQPQP